MTICDILDLANYTTAKGIVKLGDMPQCQEENQQKSNNNTLNSISTVLSEVIEATNQLMHIPMLLVNIFEPFVQDPVWFS